MHQGFAADVDHPNRGTVAELVEPGGQEVANVRARVARAYDEVGICELGDPALGSAHIRTVGRHRSEYAVDPELLGIESLMRERTQLKR